MKIELKIDGNPCRDIETDSPVTIQEIMKDCTTLKCPVLSYKINRNLYVNEEYLIEQSCLVDGITFLHPEGYRIYQDSALFLLAKAMYTIFGTGHELIAEHSISDGVYCEVTGLQSFSEDDCKRVQAEMCRIVENAVPIEKLEVRSDEAEDIFCAMGQ
jgi:uridine kinase